MDQASLDKFKELVEDRMITSSIITNKYIAKIDDILIKTQKDRLGSPYNVFSFNLYSNNSDQKVSFEFPEFILDRIEVVEISDKKEKVLDLKNPKNGDQVEAIYELNWLYPMDTGSYLDNYSIKHLKIIKL